MSEYALYEFEDDKYRLRIMVDEYPESPREWSNLATMVCGHKHYNLGDEQAERVGEYLSWEDWLEHEVLDFYTTFYNDEDAVIYLPLYVYAHGGLTMNTVGFDCRWDSGQVGWIYVTKEKLRNETGYSEKELFSTDKHRVPDVGEHVRIAKFGDEWGKVVSIEESLGKKVFTVDFDSNKALNYRNDERKVIVELDDITEVKADVAYEILVEEVAMYDLYLTGQVYGFVLEKKEFCSHCKHAEFVSEEPCWGFYGNDFESLIEDMKYNVPEDVRYLFDKLEEC